MTSPLRVVVAIDDLVVPAVCARAIDRVSETSTESLCVQVRSPATEPGRRGGMAALTDLVQRAVYRPTLDALAPVDLRLSHGDLVDLVDRSTTPAGLGAGADVVLDLTADGLAPGEGGHPPLGVWSLRFGREQRRLGAGVFEPEYLSGSGVGTCELVAELDTDDPAEQVRVLYRSVGGVDPLWPARALNEAAWKAAEFPARALAAARSGRVVAYEPSGRVPAKQAGGPSSPASVLRTMVQRGLREAVGRIGRRPSWFVAVRTGREAAPGGHGFDTTGFRALAAPPGRFYADPFVVARPDGGAYVFVEDGPLDGGPARISVLTLDPDGVQLVPGRAVLERKTHLSYPFVFEDQGSWYMLPETAGTGAIELLRAQEFPWRWEPCEILVADVRAWDPTLLRHGGHYWLFAAVAAPGARPSDELCLFFAPDLHGPWRPHPRNPVVSDVRRARPAGRVLEIDGSLIRPAQDGAGAYGRRIVLNRIDVLTPDDYEETPVGSVEPGWLPGVVRTHTYTADGGIEALDGVHYVNRFGARRSTDATPGASAAQGRPIPR